MAEREDAVQYGHTLHLANREALSLTGVVHVDTFDDQEIVLDTELGSLTVRGESLHIKRLNLEDGKLEVAGTVDGISYAPRPRTRSTSSRGKGWLERLLR